MLNCFWPTIMKSDSHNVGSSDAEKNPNVHAPMNNPTLDVQNVIINVATPLIISKEETKDIM